MRMVIDCSIFLGKSVALEGEGSVGENRIGKEYLFSSEVLVGKCLSIVFPVSFSFGLSLTLGGPVQ